MLLIPEEAVYNCEPFRFFFVVIDTNSKNLFLSTHIFCFCVYSNDFLFSVDEPDTMNTAPLNQQDEDIEVLRKKEKERIREFIEQVVNSLIGGNVDDANVTKIYNDRQCKFGIT